MEFFRDLLGCIRHLNHYSRLCVRIGVFLMVCLYILAAFAWWYAPQAASYIEALAVFDGALEAAPATLAASVCAALICDVAWHTRSKNRDEDDS